MRKRIAQLLLHPQETIVTLDARAWRNRDVFPMRQ